MKLSSQSLYQLPAYLWEMPVIHVLFHKVEKVICPVTPWLFLPCPHWSMCGPGTGGIFRDP